MDWSNEKYVRLYVRDTKTWKLLGWEGQALFCLTLRKLDRSGLMEDVHDAGDLAVMIGVPLEVVEIGLGRLLRLGVLVNGSRGLVSPNYIDAQEAKQSDAQRAREYRARRRETALAPCVEDVTKRDATASLSVTETDENVTARHSPSQPVTPAVLCCAVPSLDPPVVPQGDARRVFDHWAKTMGHERAKLDDKRRRRIEVRLKDFTAEQLCQAISGAKRDQFLMGEDPRAGRRYDGIETLLRDTAQVERLIELESRSKPKPTKPSSAGFVFDEATQTWRRTRKPPQRPVDELSVGDDPWGLDGTKRAQEPTVAPHGGIQGLLSKVGSPMDPPPVRKGKTVEEIELALAKESK